MNEYEHTKKLIAEIQAKKGWNYCNKKLPDNTRWVWVAFTVEQWVKPEITEGYYDNGRWWFKGFMTSNPDYKVYAWRDKEIITAPPIPEP